MKKEGRIARYGEAAYEKLLAQRREYNKTHKEEAEAYREAHREERKEYIKRYYEAHPEKRKANHQETNRKGGKYYDKMLDGERTGLRGERNIIRSTHQKQYRPYKQIIAPDSQLHHEWLPRTDEYRGVALVEKEQHMHGFVDVIEILDGKITLLTEEEVKSGGKKDEKKNI